MEPNDRKKIDQNIHKLACLVDMERLWPEINNTIFSSNYPGISTWENNLKAFNVKHEILLDIKTRGPRAFSDLVNGLKTTDQHCCVEILQGDGPSNIQVKKSTKFYDIDSNQNNMSKYRMRSNPRGLVLIISLINYIPKHRERTSAERDEKNLEDLFTQMGFKVQTERDLSADEIRQVIEEFSQNPELQFVDSAFIFIGAHGEMNLMGDDTVISNIDSQEEGISCNEIIDYFVPDRCEFLRNKPKIFMFQVCRGEHSQNVINTQGYSNVPFRLKTGFGKPGVDYSDMCIAHATLSDCVALRDRDDGSWFVQCIHEIFAEYACEHHVESLFSLVDVKISTLKTSDGSGKTICQTSPLQACHFKECFINPGLFENNR